MLFLTADGTPMTKNRIEFILNTYGKRAGISGVRVSPHTFRHTGAVAFLRNGGDLFTLQRIMGHSSLEILRGYVNLNQDDLKRIHEKASPLDNLEIPKHGGRKVGK
jgi:integrase/recombinase XerD